MSRLMSILTLIKASKYQADLCGLDNLNIFPWKELNKWGWFNVEIKAKHHYWHFHVDQVWVARCILLWIGLWMPTLCLQNWFYLKGKAVEKWLGKKQLSSILSDHVARIETETFCSYFWESMSSSICTNTWLYHMPGSSGTQCQRYSMLSQWVAWHLLCPFRTGSIGYLLPEEPSFLLTIYILWMFAFLLTNLLNFARNVTEIYSLAGIASIVYFKFYNAKLFLNLCNYLSVVANGFIITQGHM